MTLNKEPLLMDQAGYERYLASIDILREEIRSLQKNRRAENLVIDRDSWNNTGTADIDRQERILLARLQDLIKDLSRIQIIERQNSAELGKDAIDLNDIIKIEYIFAEDDKEEETVRLVSVLGEKIDGVIDVSINSPLGSAIYQKKAGDTVSYKVEANAIKVTIKDVVKEQKFGRN